MKKLFIIFAVVLFTAGFASKVSAQITKSNSAGGEIMSPITLSADVSLQFGRMAVQTATGGTVVLTPASATAASTTGGVTLMTGVARTAAKYTVGGIGSYVYTITVPTNGTVTITDGASHTMSISDFTFVSIASASATGGTLTSSGTDNFYVGGTLNVDAAQVAGQYTGSFDVSVNYN